MIKLTALIFALARCASAQTPPNFTGVWELNKANTPASRSMPDRMRFKIDHQGGVFAFTLRVVNGAESEQQDQRYAIGSESKNLMHGAPMTSHSEWDGDTLVVHSVAIFGTTELRMTDRFSLSPDKNVLTFRERHKFGDEPEAEDTRVFDRKPEGSWEPDAPPKAAEEVYKNIQIMQGLPAPRLRGVMVNLTRWLGVDCEHCHVRDLEKDDKPAKQTARNMFKMVRAINQDNFSGSSPVTCWTCHRGEAKPQSLPPEK